MIRPTVTRCTICYGKIRHVRDVDGREVAIVWDAAARQMAGSAAMVFDPRRMRLHVCDGLPRQSRTNGFNRK